MQNLNAWKGFGAGLVVMLGCSLFLAVMVSGCKTTEQTPVTPVNTFHVQVIINDLNGDRVYNEDCVNGCYWNAQDNSYDH